MKSNAVPLVGAFRIVLLLLAAAGCNSGTPAPPGRDGLAPPHDMAMGAPPAPDLAVPVVISLHYRPAQVDTLAQGLRNPTGVVLRGDGSLVVTDYDAAVVDQVSADGQVSALLAGMSGFAGPFAAVLTAKGDLLVQTDFDAHGVKNDDTGTLWRVQGGAAQVLVEGLGRPRGLASLPDGRVFVADRRRHVVGVLDPMTGTLQPLAGKSGEAGYQDGQGAGARFASPYGCAVLPDGSVVVADLDNHRLRQVTLDGRVTTYAGDGTPGAVDGPREAARFLGLEGVAADRAGNVYVSDGDAFLVRLVPVSGDVVTLAGDGQPGHRDGAGAQARFYGLEGITVAPDGGTVYVSDGNQGKPNIQAGWVRKITVSAK